jgi:hypothetical protein
MALRTDWKKSSYSTNGGQDCVEARKRHTEGTGLAVQLRDSRLGDASPVLTVTPRAFRTLLGSIKQA